MNNILYVIINPILSIIGIYALYACSGSIPWTIILWLGYGIIYKVMLDAITHNEYSKIIKEFDDNPLSKDSIKKYFHESLSFHRKYIHYNVGFKFIFICIVFAYKYFA